MLRRMNTFTRRRTFALLAGAALAPLPAWADPGPLDAVADRLVASGANVHSLLVARGGPLVFERYFTGSDEIMNRRVKDATHGVDTLHDMKSVSKSVASLVFGIAVDRGLIGSLDQPVLNFFPELADLRTPEKDRIKLVHALTMTLGLKWEEATPATGDEDNDEARMNRARDGCRFVLGSLPVTDPAGEKFFYNTGALRLTSAIVRKATGRPLDEFARTALFEPLGISAFEWNRIKGDTDTGGGLRLRSRDMMKIGQLVLNGGNWNGRQIVSKAWIDASMTPHTKASAKYDYGYLWWLGRAPFNGREVRVLAALGRGGQSIRMVPELDLVVAVTAGYYQDYSPQAFELQAGIFTDLLKAVPPG
jgi:CubicO group peptidase (beta-lactamase class C family)